MILTVEFTLTAPKAFPENTFTLTVPSADGKAIAPEINPAFRRTDKRGATAFAIRSCEKTIVVAPIDSAA